MAPLQAHLKAALFNATPKLLKELVKIKLRKPIIQNWLHLDNLKTLAIIKRTSFGMECQE